MQHRKVLGASKGGLDTMMLLRLTQHRSVHAVPHTARMQRWAVDHHSGFPPQGTSACTWQPTGTMALLAAALWQQ